VSNLTSRREAPDERDAHQPAARRVIEDMTVRNFVEKTRHDYIRHVRTFTDPLVLRLRPARDAA
jgi:hypothetical protein